MTSPANQNRQTQITATKLGARLFRQNVGFGWIAGPKDTLKANARVQVFMNPGDVLLRQARPFQAGAEGMSDGGGFVPVVVTPEMVGKRSPYICRSRTSKDRDGSPPLRPLGFAWSACSAGARV